MTAWYYVSMPWATFAVAVVDDRVVQTAPIARRWVGRQPWSQTRAWLEGKGATITEM